MVKFNFWEKFYGKRPKKFKSEANKQIKDNTLSYMQKYGRTKWVPVIEIFEKTLEQTDLFNSKEGKMFFASKGIKSKINWATGELRRKGYPIISGRGHKGYMYADEDCDDFIDRWDEVLSAREKRKTKLEKEYTEYEKLIAKICERLIEKGRLQEAKQLQEVLVKYN